MLDLVRLTTSLPTLTTPSLQSSSSSSSSSTTTSSAPDPTLTATNSKQQQQKRQPKLQSATAEMQNPTIHQYSGDFFVETVSLSSSQERGTFVTSNTDDDSASNGDDSTSTSSTSSSSSSTFSGGNNGVGGSSSSSSEILGNKLPISWFATSQQHSGNWQLKNNAVNPYVHTNANNALKTKNLYNTNLNSMSVDDEDDENNEDIDLDEDIENGQDIVNVAEGRRKESLEVKAVDVDNKPSNGFYKATKKGFKLKQQQQQQQQQRQHQLQHDTTNNNKWHYIDNIASSSAASSSLSSSSHSSTATSTATKKKRRKSVELENTSNICSSENKWQGRTKSYTNAAGGISTESLGLWLVNELCEQDDTIEFR